MRTVVTAEHRASEDCHPSGMCCASRTLAPAEAVCGRTTGLTGCGQGGRRLMSTVRPTHTRSCRIASTVWGPTAGGHLAGGSTHRDPHWAAVTVRDGVEPQHEGGGWRGREHMARSVPLRHSLSELWGGFGGPPMESWGWIPGTRGLEPRGRYKLTRWVVSAGVPDLLARTALPRANDRVPRGGGEPPVGCWPQPSRVVRCVSSPQVAAAH